MGLNLAQKIAGLELRNPTILSAGILGLTGLGLKNVWEAGAGAVVTKSLGLKGRKGYPNPTIVNVGYGFVNAMGLPNPGVKEYSLEIKTVKSSKETCLIASIYGALPEEIAKAALVVEEAGADAVELNLSCPNVKQVGMEVGQDPILVHNIISAVKNVVKIPVFAKLSPNVSDIKVLAQAAANAGVDGLVAINTIKAMTLDLETGRPILANKMGGLSGPAIKPIALRCVYEVSQSINIPVIGCGGIASWEDAVEFLLAGASAVQIGTAIAYKGLGVFNEITSGLEWYLKRKHFKSIGEIIGRSHKY